MRKAQAKKLPLAPDPKFNDKLVTRFVNNLMWEGKKSVSTCKSRVTRWLGNRCMPFVLQVQRHFQT